MLQSGYSLGRDPRSLNNINGNRDTPKKMGLASPDYKPNRPGNDKAKDKTQIRDDAKNKVDPNINKNDVVNGNIDTATDKSQTSEDQEMSAVENGGKINDDGTNIKESEVIQNIVADMGSTEQTLESKADQSDQELIHSNV